MIIYIDRLTIRACLNILPILRTRADGGNASVVKVLDPLPGGIRTRLLAYGLSLLGARVEETDFFAGHLKSLDGESAYTAALSMGNNLALTVAKKTVWRSPLLARMNQKWGGKAVELHLAKSFWKPAFDVALHVMVASALAREEECPDVHHVVELPPVIDPDWVERPPGLTTKLHFSARPSLRDSRLYAPFWCLFRKAYGLMCQLKGSTGSRPGEGARTLLLMQEDELSLDRSFRGQPHWYFREDGRLPFDVIVIQSAMFKDSAIDRKELSGEGIITVPKEELHSSGISADHPLQKRIRKDMLSLVLGSIAGGAAGRACTEAAMLFHYADLLTSFCSKYKVGAFMTCENYFIQSDAMGMIAPHLGIATLSYQYSNMGEVSPLMMTTADTLFSFSPVYHERWTRGGIGPGRCVDTGYLFDRSFTALRERARSRREQLLQAGVKFIICYLDESVQEDKYGLIHRDDHLGEIRALIHYLLNDPTCALVVKTQFKRNSPMGLEGKDDLFHRAARTGRYIELSHGSKVRNSIFPAEAAMCSDIVIGHAIGATAALEAALAGARCILLNPYGFKGANDDIHREADILYPSIESALAAIDGYRSVKTSKSDLGDWSSIIGHFDPFRDGKSSTRLRHHIEALF